MEWLRHIEEFLRKSAKSDIEDLMQVPHQPLNWHLLFRPLTALLFTTLYCFAFYICWSSWHSTTVRRSSCRST